MTYSNELLLFVYYCLVNWLSTLSQKEQNPSQNAHHPSKFLNMLRRKNQMVFFKTAKLRSLRRIFFISVCVSNTYLLDSLDLNQFKVVDILFKLLMNILLLILFFRIFFFDQIGTFFCDHDCWSIRMSPNNTRHNACINHTKSFNSFNF